MNATVPARYKSPTSRFAKIAIVVTLLVCLLACVLAGLVFSNVLDGRPRDRAIWGILLMALAPVGVVVTIWTVLRRDRLSVPSSSRRWLSFLQLPGSFLLAWALVFGFYGNLENSSVHALIPHTPTLTVDFTGKPQPSFNTHGIFGNSDSGWNELRTDGKIVGEIPFHYNAVSTEIDPLEIKLAGAAKESANSRLEIHFVLMVRQRTHIQIRGLENSAITRDGKPCGEQETIDAGTYQFTIAGDRQ